MGSIRNRNNTLPIESAATPGTSAGVSIHPPATATVHNTDVFQPRVVAESSSVTRPRSPIAWLVALACVLVVVVQVSDGAYRSDLATHSDEAAHFVTATLLLDYLGTAFGTNPVSFAYEYYAHYPKVAFGHWPPLFYVIQAAWYALVGTSPAAGLLLIGVIAATAGALLAVRLQRWFGAVNASLVLGVMFVVPVVRVSSAALMPDMLAALFVLLALLAFCDRTEPGVRWASPWFAVWASAAILTKASALSLLPFAVVGQLLLPTIAARRPTPRGRAWIASGLLILTPLAVLGLAEWTGLRPFPSLDELPALRDRIQFLTRLPQIVPWPLLVVALVGSVGAIRPDPDDPRRMVVLRASVLLLAAWLGAQILVRDMVEDRYFLPALFPLFILFAAGLNRLANTATAWTQARWRVPAWRNAATGWGVTAALCLWSVGAMPVATAPRRSGYSAVADAVSSAGGGPAVLVASDPRGEGALIVAALMRDDRSNRVIVRASKLLASSDWMGGYYQPLATSPAQVLALLDAVPIRFIVLDEEGSVDEQGRPHHQLLERAIVEQAGRFGLIGEFPLRVGIRERAGRVRVYENLSPAARSPAIVHVPATAALGRAIDVRVETRVGLARSGETRLGRALQATSRWLYGLVFARSSSTSS